MPLDVDGLTPKQEKFVKAYVETGNGTQSAMSAYKSSNENVAAVAASKNLRKPKIRAAIAQYSQEVQDILNPERIARNVERLATKAEDRDQLAVALRAQELLAKPSGAFDSPDQDDHGDDRIVVNINLS